MLSTHPHRLSASSPVGRATFREIYGSGERGFSETLSFSSSVPILRAARHTCGIKYQSFKTAFTELI